MNWSLPFDGLLSRAGSSSSTGLVIMFKIQSCQIPVKIIVLKEFPLEVKADCAIKLQLEACLGQGYRCDVSNSTSAQCSPLPNFQVRTSEGGRVAVATIAKGGDRDLVATLQVTIIFLSDQLSSELMLPPQGSEIVSPPPIAPATKTAREPCCF